MVQRMRHCKPFLIKKRSPIKFSKMTIFRAIKYQPIPLVITGAGLSATTNAFTTDKNYKTVSGIKARTNEIIKLALCGLTFTKFEINSQEIYAEGMDVEDISSDTGVAPNERFDKEVDEPAEGSTVNITITDGSVAGQVYPYTVKILLKLTNPLS